jgi:fluoride ion exporter CrcB/FEX
MRIFPFLLLLTSGLSTIIPLPTNSTVILEPSKGLKTGAVVLICILITVAIGVVAFVIGRYIIRRRQYNAIN